MELSTRTHTVTTEWTLVTDKVAMLQFNDEMYILITHNNTPPTADVGIIIQAGDQFTNAILNSFVWVKKKFGGTNIESVRIIEEVL